MAFNENSLLQNLVIPGIGKRALRSLADAGCRTIGDYLKLENWQLCEVPLVGMPKIKRLDAYLAQYGFDTKSRWESQYYQFPGTYVASLQHKPSQGHFYHLIMVGNAWNVRPRGLCGQRLNEVKTFRLPPRGYEFCCRCNGVIDLEVARRAGV